MLGKFLHALFTGATDPLREHKIGHLDSTPIYSTGPQQVIVGRTG